MSKYYSLGLDYINKYLILYTFSYEENNNKKILEKTEFLFVNENFVEQLNSYVNQEYQVNLIKKWIEDGYYKIGNIVLCTKDHWYFKKDHLNQLIYFGDNLFKFYIEVIPKGSDLIDELYSRENRRPNRIPSQLKIKNFEGNFEWIINLQEIKSLSFENKDPIDFLKISNKKFNHLILETNNIENNFHIPFIETSFKSQKLNYQKKTNMNFEFNLLKRPYEELEYNCSKRQFINLKSNS